MAVITIAGRNVSGYVTIQPFVSQKIRSESISYALNGSMLIDRVGNPKKRITVTVGSMPAQVWASVKQDIKEPSFAVAFNDGFSDVVSGNFHLMSEIPDNYIYFGGSSGNPTTVGGFSLEMEEV